MEIQARYLVNRIKEGKIDYDYAISKRPDLKDLIDSFLKE